MALRLELRRTGRMRGADGGAERACRGPGSPDLGAEGRPMPGSRHRLPGHRRRGQGRLGVQLPLDLARFSRVRPIRSGPRPRRRLHRPCRTRQLLSEGSDRDHRRRPLARRRTGAARGLFRFAHPAGLRLRSLDGDRILFGRPPEPRSQRSGLEDGARLRIRRSPRLRPVDHAAHYPVVALAIRASSASGSGSFRALRSLSTA